MIILIALIIISLSVTALVQGSAVQSAAALVRRDSQAALHGADAAANMALREISANFDEDGDGNIGSIGGATGRQVGTATVKTQVSKSGSIYTLTAQGTSGQSTHAYELVVEQTTGGATPGLYAEYYALSTCYSSLQSIPWSNPTAAGIVPNVNLPYVGSNSVARWARGANAQFAIRYTGTITIPAAGTWTFSTYSDDNSELFINGTLVVDNDGIHSPQTRSGSIILPQGPATFQVLFHECTGESVVQARWQGPTVPTTTLIPESAFFCTPTVSVPGLVGANSMAFHGSGTLNEMNIDAFNSQSAIYGGSNILTTGHIASTNSTSSQAWQMSNGARVQGDVRVGVGGSPSTVIVTWSGSSITGTRQAATINVGIGAIGTPSSMPSTLGALATSGTITWNSDRRYSSVQLWGSSTTLNISGNIVVQCDGDFSLSSASQIVIPDGSSLTLYVGGNVNFWNTSQGNAASGRPSRFKIFMYGANGDMQVSDSAKVCAVVLCPYGDLNLYGTGSPPAEFFGVFQGDRVNATDKADIHVDRAFGAAGASGSEGLRIQSWIQIR